MSTFQIINLPTHSDTRGSLSVIEGLKDIPFEIYIVYFIHDFHYTEKQNKNEKFILSLHGKIEIVIYNGIHKQSVLLNKPSCGVYIPRGCDIEIKKPHSSSIALILESDNAK